MLNLAKVIQASKTTLQVVGATAIIVSVVKNARVK